MNRCRNNIITIDVYIDVTVFSLFVILFNYIQILIDKIQSISQGIFNFDNECMIVHRLNKFTPVTLRLINHTRIFYAGSLAVQRIDTPQHFVHNEFKRIFGIHFSQLDVSIVFIHSLTVFTDMGRNVSYTFCISLLVYLVILKAGQLVYYSGERVIQMSHISLASLVSLIIERITFLILCDVGQQRLQIRQNNIHLVIQLVLIEQHVRLVLLYTAFHGYHITFKSGHIALEFTLYIGMTCSKRLSSNLHISFHFSCTVHKNCVSILCGSSIRVSCQFRTHACNPSLISQE